MTDYDKTKKASRYVAGRFRKALENLAYDYEDEVMQMGHWHYQLMRHQDNSGEKYYAIHEYFHMDDGDGWTENPVSVTGESVEDVKKSLVMMLNDIDRHGVKEYNHHADQMSK